MLLLPLLAIAGFFAYKAHTAQQQQPRMTARTGATAWVPTNTLTHGRVHRFVARAPAHYFSAAAITHLLAQRGWSDIAIELGTDGSTYQAIATWLGHTAHADPNDPASRTLEQLVRNSQLTAGDEMSMSTAGVHLRGRPARDWGWGGWGTAPTYLLEPEYAILDDPWGNPFIQGTPYWYAQRLGGGPMVRRQA